MPKTIGTHRKYVVQMASIFFEVKTPLTFVKQVAELGPSNGNDTGKRQMMCFGMVLDAQFGNMLTIT